MYDSDGSPDLYLQNTTSPMKNYIIGYQFQKVNLSLFFGCIGQDLQH